MQPNGKTVRLVCWGFAALLLIADGLALGLIAYLRRKLAIVLRA